MPRGTTQPQSVAHLPPAIPNGVAPTQRVREGKTLTNGTVAGPSHRHHDLVESAPRSFAFAITDLLAVREGKQQAHRGRKRDKPGAVEPPLSLPLSPIQLTPNNKASRTQSYLLALDRPENTELFTYASALCHRITGRYMSKDHLQRDPDAQKNEVARIQRDPELLQAIAVIKTLSKEFQDVAHATLGHRKELGHALLRIEESYLKLFEKLLELSLRMYWKYEQDHDAERRADKKTIAYWQEMHNWKAGEATKLQKLLDGKEIVLRAKQIELEDLERQCAELQREVGDQRILQEQVFELQAVERELHARERTQQTEYLALKTKHEEMVVAERARLEDAHELHKHLMDEMRHSLREKEQQIARHNQKIHELTVLLTPTITSEASTQTTVDDDGLWDAQDGVPRFVSKDLLHRSAWRRFHAYANCKNCRGRPMQQPRGVARDPGSVETDDAYVDVWSLARSERKSKKAMKRIEAIEAEWRLPPAILLFLSNLPKSVVAFPFYSLAEVIERIDLIYDDKFETDRADEADGVAREELPSFICEYFLKTHGLRQSAEIGLYRFLISVKHMFRSNSHVHLFARFCGLLPSDSSATVIDPVPSAAGALMASLVEQPRRGELDRSFLRVFLHARYILLRPPPPKISKNGVVVAPPQPHVVQADALKRWVPLDHAVAVTRWYVNFLPEDAVIALCREVEYSTASYAGHAITEITGNRLAVRAEMRKAMLANANDPEPGESAGEDRRTKPRIVADVHKVLLLLLHALEQRRDIMETALIAMFDAGDVNHDCVLSFDEFKAIVRGRAASFSDRRLLRMFREALMGSVDQSFALSMDAFVKVCNDHGLVALLPDDRWEDPFPKLPNDVLEKAASAMRKATAARKSSSMRKSARKAALIDDPPLPEIPEDLPQLGESTLDLSPRAEEVDEDDDLWEW